MTPENTNNDTSYELAAIRNQLFTLLIALIVVTGTFTVYLFRQTSMAGKDIAQAVNAEKEMGGTEAAITDFVNKLVIYGEKHPEFLPVLKRHGIAPVPGVPPVAPPR
jgi:hypothetical protein